MAHFYRSSRRASTCSRRRTWESQPYIGNTPAGNILTSAAILYSGTLPSKAFRMFRVLDLCMMSQKTFFRHQRKYLQPAVSCVWKHSQELILTTLKDKGSSLVLGGDGRSDSPGHSAKYGSYSVLELTCNKIVDFKLVQVSIFCVCMFNVAATMQCTLFCTQSNEVGSSNHMEKGLHRVLEFLKEKDLQVGTLVTDRHQQITKWIRECHPNVKTLF